MELPVEARSQLADGAAEALPDWRAGLAPLLLGGGLAALLASLAGKQTQAPTEVFL